MSDLSNLNYPIIVVTNDEIGGYSNNYRFRGGYPDEKDKYEGSIIFDSDENEYVIKEINVGNCNETLFRRLINPARDNWKYAWNLEIGYVGRVDFSSALKLVMKRISEVGWFCASERTHTSGECITCVTEYSPREIKKVKEKLDNEITIAGLAKILTDPTV